MDRMVEVPLWVVVVGLVLFLLVMLPAFVAAEKNRGKPDNRPWIL